LDGTGTFAGKYKTNGRVKRIRKRKRKMKDAR
jgi:hypothetical protein